MRRSLFSRRQPDYEDPYASGRPDAVTYDAAEPASQSLTDKKNAPFLRLICVFCVFAALTLFCAYRLSVRGHWLPTAPLEISRIWEATELPLPPSALAQIGFAPTQGYRYSNLFGERVEAHLISTPTFDAYRDPPICLSGYGYSLTGEKTLPLFGPGKEVRALVLRNDATGDRILMYYWIQYKNGKTLTGNNLRGGQNVFPRFSLGLSSILRSDENCIVRAYTQVHPRDTKGHQARRNLEQICRALYDSLDRQAKGKSANEPVQAGAASANIVQVGGGL